MEFHVSQGCSEGSYNCHYPYTNLFIELFVRSRKLESGIPLTVGWDFPVGPTYIWRHRPI